VLDTSSGLLRYSCAGHAGPAILRASGAAEVLRSPAMAVGWVEDAAFDDLSLALSPGDRVYVYSDGITEAQDPERRQLGHEGVLAALIATRGAPLEQSLAELTARAEAWGGTPFNDDVSALALEVRPG
jgi:sigma-B regulation protein RsbU (phosphoserine phosphatase)